MRWTLSVLMCLALAAAAPAAGVSLTDGVLHLDSNESGCWFLVNEFGGKVIVYFDLRDGAGMKSKFYEPASVKSVAFVGGAGNDFCQVRAKRPATFDGKGGSDSMLGAAGAANSFTVDGEDFIGRNANDKVTGSPQAEYVYPGQ